MLERLGRRAREWNDVVFVNESNYTGKTISPSSRIRISLQDSKISAIKIDVESSIDLSDEPSRFS